MTYFIPTEKEGTIRCYEGTTCSKESPAELTNPLFIDKAQRNPDFEEVVKVPKADATEIPKNEKPKVTKKKVAKKRGKKKEK